MSNKTIPMTDELHEYMLTVSLREPALLTQLREETAALSERSMQISPEQGQFMQLLVKLLGVQKVIEIGVFTGYSSLAVALALPEEGRIVACDVSAEFTSTARRYWATAGVAHKIALCLAPAVDTLRHLLAQGQAGQYDFAFIDADKPNYPHYVELVYQLLRPGGLIAIDNVLWSGRVADPTNQEESTLALRELNQQLHQDARFDLSLVPIGDGVTLLRKR